MATFESRTREDLPKPAGAYGHVVRAGSFVYTAGFGPQDPGTGELPDGVAAQTQATLDNVERALSTHGLGLADVVKATVHLQELVRDFGEFNEVYNTRFSDPLPVRTTVGSDLMKILVEIDVVAYKPVSGRANGRED